MRPGDLQILHEILEARSDFGHREHLELAWTLLQRHPIDEAAEAMGAALRHVAALHGAEDKYHETITRAWFHCVAVHAQRWGADDFDEFVQRNPDLLDGKLLEHFYTRELILSGEARADWEAPDIRPLPALV